MKNEITFKQQNPIRIISKSMNISIKLK